MAQTINSGLVTAEVSGNVDSLNIGFYDSSQTDDLLDLTDMSISTGNGGADVDKSFRVTNIFPAGILKISFNRQAANSGTSTWKVFKNDVEVYTNTSSAAPPGPGVVVVDIEDVSNNDVIKFFVSNTGGSRNTILNTAKILGVETNFERPVIYEVLI
jgi:hypothetical protein